VLYAFAGALSCIRRRSLPFLAYAPAHTAFASFLPLFLLRRQAGASERQKTSGGDLLATPLCGAARRLEERKARRRRFAGTRARVDAFSAARCATFRTREAWPQKASASTSSGGGLRNGMLFGAFRITHGVNLMASFSSSPSSVLVDSNIPRIGKAKHGRNSCRYIRRIPARSAHSTAYGRLIYYRRPF